MFIFSIELELMGVDVLNQPLHIGKTSSENYAMIRRVPVVSNFLFYNICYY